MASTARTPAPDDRGDRRGETAASRRWAAATSWPRTLAALIYLIAYTWRVVGDHDRDLWGLVFAIVIALTWAVFVTDYLVRLVLSHPKGRWFRTHLFDLAVVLVPTLRPVALLRIFTLPRFLNRTAGDSLRARLLIYGSAATLLLIWQASLLVLQVERASPDGNIRTFGDAVWWAFCTVTTVGYGDYTPVTAPGRIVAVLLMVGGVVLVGLVTASFASWVTERATRGHEDEVPATRADVQRILDAVRRQGPAAHD